LHELRSGKSMYYCHGYMKYENDITKIVTTTVIAITTEPTPGRHAHVCTNSRLS